MESEQTSEISFKEKQASALNTVTPLSKYLAMTLFIALPFVGGYVGYSFAPEKIVEVENIIEVEKVAEVVTQSTETHLEEESLDVSTYINTDLGFTFEYPSEFGDLYTDYFPSLENVNPDQTLFRVWSEDGSELVAVLYGKKYDSGTGTSKQPICTNSGENVMKQDCTRLINSAGTPYYQLDILYEYTAGWQRRYEIEANEDFSMMVFVSGTDDGGFSDLSEYKEMLLQSFTLIN